MGQWMTDRGASGRPDQQGLRPLADGADNAVTTVSFAWPRGAFFAGLAEETIFQRVCEKTLLRLARGPPECGKSGGCANSDHLDGDVLLGCDDEIIAASRTCRAPTENGSGCKRHKSFAAAAEATTASTDNPCHMCEGSSFYCT